MNQDENKKLEELIMTLIERSHQGVSTSVSGLGGMIKELKDSVFHLEQKFSNILENQNSRLSALEDDSKIRSHDREKFGRNVWLWRFVGAVVVSVIGFYAVLSFATAEKVSKLEIQVQHHKDGIQDIKINMLEIQKDIKELLKR